MNRRSINLLTWRFRFYLLVRARLLQWCVVLAVCSLVLVVLWQLENHRIGTAMDALAIMESRCAPLQQMQSENVQLANRVSELNSHQSLLTRLDDEQVPYRLLGLVSRTVAECLGSIRIDSVSLERRMEAESQDPKKTVSPSDKPKTDVAASPKLREITTLTLNGLADDNITVSQFVGLLRDSQVFESVELVSSTGVDSEARRTQAFLVKSVL